MNQNSNLKHKFLRHLLKGTLLASVCFSAVGGSVAVHASEQNFNKVKAVHATKHGTAKTHANAKSDSSSSGLLGSTSSSEESMDEMEKITNDYETDAQTASDFMSGMASTLQTEADNMK